MKRYLLVFGLIVLVLLCGCGSTEKNDVKYLNRTLADGITFSIPESWEDYETDSDTDASASGLCYFFSGEVNKKHGELAGYDYEGLDEAFIICISISKKNKDMSAKEQYDYWENALANYADVHKTKIDGISSIYYDDEDYGTDYIIPLSDGKSVFVRWIKKDGAITKHSSEIEKVIDSITIDKSLK